MWFHPALKFIGYVVHSHRMPEVEVKKWSFSDFMTNETFKWDHFFLIIVSWSAIQSFVVCSRLSFLLGHSCEMVPLLSKAWSCSTLMAANQNVQQHYEQLVSEQLSEAEMLKQLADPCPRFLKFHFMFNYCFLFWVQMYR